MCFGRIREEEGGCALDVDNRPKSSPTVDKSRGGNRFRTPQERPFGGLGPPVRSRRDSRGPSEVILAA